MPTGDGSGSYPFQEVRDGFRDQRQPVAKAVLVAGGTFATAISAILGAVGLYGLGNAAIVASLTALCFIAASTMFTVAWMLKNWS